MLERYEQQVISHSALVTELAAYAHPVSLKHFLVRAQQTGAFDDVETITVDMLRQALHKRVDEVDFQQAKTDVRPFLSNVDGLEIWSDKYFHQLVNKVVGVSS